MSDYGTDIVTVGRALPKLAGVEPGNGRFDVRVTWASGERAGRTDTVDLAPMIFTFKVFKPLRDGTVAFDAVRLGDYGASIVWPDNDDLDIGADAIEEMASEAMTNADFEAFLKRNRLTFDAAAAQLGIARRLVAYYAKEREIPRYIALACRQLDLMLGAADEQVPAAGEPSVAGGMMHMHSMAAHARSHDFDDMAHARGYYVPHLERGCLLASGPIVSTPSVWATAPENIHRMGLAGMGAAGTQRFVMPHLSGKAWQSTASSGAIPADEVKDWMIKHGAKQRSTDE
ncbi:hypothetical protein [Methylobacterium terricola]|uniref:hypothetical protein n=1 Tax=Methylobacterium terricola TaxID=2583531 RepID=UPI001FE3F9B2|nr:hypothetical protein [Methylobacterium terricola]